ncbi:MAG: exodeoxyribonuclease VII large subunit [Candidatus Marinimicrobia bacterium]|nr:exodeoxyribonuclease VII large subunit [Candidatus Neomarinimicrobiota bacterium]MBL7060080.1 exodeoxyribonuclease VII large subunit [Candidatus Neomarinimicrobiota bacterium]
MNSDTPISVSELTKDIKSLLEGAFPHVWITGEISNFIHPRSGHMYFTLKDNRSEIRSVMFKGSNQFMRFRPEEGMKVFVHGRISVYEKRGSYQLTVGKMEPAGLGALYLAFEALKKQLNEEGLFDSALKKPFPEFPRRIGVVTSGTGAAVRDIIQVLGRRAPYATVIVRPTKVQGDSAADDIVQALREFENYGAVDLLIVGRGGGSLEDLWPFNEEKTARAIFECNLPVISAVGHETDTTITDLVADLRAPTPSAAAELAVPNISDIIDQLMTTKNNIDRLLQSRLEQRWQCLDTQAGKLAILHPGKRIDRRQKTLAMLYHQLNLAWQNGIDKKRAELFGFSEQLELLNPQAVLERGYSIAFTSTGEVVRAAADISMGTEFELQTAEGRLIAEKVRDEERE